MQKLVMQLADAGKHEHVIALIEAALIHGQSQPWMYEVLALEMEIVGRPREQVERVLLSIPDFTGKDLGAMYYSAAYLTRFNRLEQALRLYRQASWLEPTRPEPYIMGLQLARKLKNFEAIQWTASGILTYAWMKGYKLHHQQAEDALKQAHLDLMKQGQSEQAEQMLETLREAKKRDLIIRLEWAGIGDVDLIVEEPPGTVCSFQNPQSAGGGVLVHDGIGFLKDDRYDEYICAYGIPGNYQVRIRYLAGDIIGMRAKLTVIRYQGTPEETVSTVVVPLSQKEKVVRLALAEGRRTKLRPIPEANEMTAVPRAPQQRRPVGLLNMVGPLDPAARRAGQRFQQSRQQLEMANPEVGYQPVISVLSEGISNQAMAVISGDRRYVRITAAPVFSTITDIFTFSIIGGSNQNQNGNLNQNGN